MSLKAPGYCKIDTEINYGAIFKNIFSDSELGLIVLDSDGHVVNQTLTNDFITLDIAVFAKPWIPIDHMPVRIQHNKA